MAMEQQRKTFLSYSRVNTDFAKKLARELKAEGFNVWLDQLDIPLGARWDVELEKALAESEIFMIIMTPDSISSENVRDEIGYAIDTGKRFLPIMLETCDVPLRLRRFQYVDFSTKSFEDGVESAKRLLRGLIAEDTIPRGKLSDDTQAKVAQAEADRKAKKDAERIAKRSADAALASKVDADGQSSRDAESDRIKASRENVIKASDLLAQGKKFFENQEYEKAADKFRQVLTLTPNHAETTKLLADAEAQIAQKKKEVESKANDEAERLARQKAEADRKAKEEAERLARQKAEADRKAREEAERQTQGTPLAATPTQKKPFSKGLIFGGIAGVVVCVVVAVFGINALSNLPVSPPVEPPEVTEAPPEDPEPPTDDCPWESNQPVRIYVDNQYGPSVDVYWINCLEEEEYWGTIDAGGYWELDTYVTHVWLFLDSQTGDYVYDFQSDGSDYVAIPGDGSVPTEPPQDPTIFFDDFSDPNNYDWGGYGYISNGKFYLEATDNQYYVRDSPNPDFRDYGPDLYIAVDVVYTSEALAGIYCRSQSGAFYLFQIVFDSSSAQIWYNDGTDWDLLAEESVNLPNETNMSVWCGGDELYFYLDGDTVAQATDNRLPDAGQVGLYVESTNPSGSTVEFDNFYVGY